jgi:hypothetical protein
MRVSNIFRALALAGLVATPAAHADALISNGTIRMGVTSYGSLVVTDPDPTATQGATGLRYLPTNGEALAPGCWCEAWGVADATSLRQGNAGQASGNENIIAESFTSSASTATAVTRINDGTDLFRVTHQFAPSARPELYQVTVTIENISGAAAQLRYRRAMDWDVPTTEFSELVTLYTGSASNIVFTSDDGFASGNPLSGPSSILFTGQATDSGPEDHGALFDFDFGTLAAGASKQFTIFYGAAGTQANALAALSAVGAEAYSLGKADPAQTGLPNGEPNTFIFGFQGVGGTPVDPGGQVPPKAVPAGSPAGYALMAVMLAGLAFMRLNRQRKAG